MKARIRSYPVQLTRHRTAHIGAPIFRKTSANMVSACLQSAIVRPTVKSQTPKSARSIRAPIRCSAHKNGTGHVEASKLAALAAAASLLLVRSYSTIVNYISARLDRADLRALAVAPEFDVHTCHLHRPSQALPDLSVTCYQTPLLRYVQQSLRCITVVPIEGSLWRLSDNCLCLCSPLRRNSRETLVKDANCRQTLAQRTMPAVFLLASKEVLQTVQMPVIHLT